MSVNPILQIPQQNSVKLDQSLWFTNDALTQKTLTLGQVLKGKVLRQYDGNHYSVSFNGMEKVVDSSIPLKPGELIHGRVVGLGDKIKLQRLFIDEQTGRQIEQQSQPQLEQQSQQKLQEQAGRQKSSEALSAKERMLEQMFARYQEKLSVQDRENVLKELNRVANSELMALSGLVLKKVGLTQEPQFLRAMFKQLNGPEQYRADQKKPITGVPAFSVHAETSDSEKGQDNTIQNISSMLMDLAKIENDTFDFSFTNLQMSSDTQSGDHQSESNFDEKFNEMLLGRRILNTQGDGSVAHWYTTIPIWINGKLVELNMVLFNQHDFAPAGLPAIKHKKIVFSIETEYLGNVQISVVCANKNLKLDIVADNEYAVEYMSQHIRELKGSLNCEGWHIEEINYGVADQGIKSGVVTAVVEHHITKGSLNQLV